MDEDIYNQKYEIRYISRGSLYIIKTINIFCLKYLIQDILSKDKGGNLETIDFCRTLEKAQIKRKT